MSRVHEANQEFIASVIVHESVHAYLDSKGFLYNTNKHQIMLADYVSVIARYLANNYGISEQDAFSLSFEGMEDIFANKLDSTTKQNIINELGNLLPSYNDRTRIRADYQMGYKGNKCETIIK